MMEMKHEPEEKLLGMASKLLKRRVIGHTIAKDQIIPAIDLEAYGS